MQKLKLLGVCIYFMIAIQSGLYAQSTPAQISIPFRVGDKFGITDGTGKFVIQPQFDWIEISNLNQEILTGYSIKNGIVLSSLIYQNKILLLNQNYKDYILKKGLFVAIKFKIIDEKNPDLYERFIQQMDLFTIDGKKLINGNFTDVAILNGIDLEESLDQTLVSTTDTAKRYSVFIYDRKLKTIIKKYIVNSNYIRITNNAAVNYTHKSYTIVFKDAQGIGHQLQIVNNGKSLILASDKTVAITPERPRQNNGVPFFDFPENTRRFKSDTNAIRDSVSRVANTFEIKSRYYYFPETIEQLKNTVSQLNGPELVTISGKRALRDKNLMVIPAVYDDIYQCEYDGSAEYVLRMGKTYKVAYLNSKPVIIPTTFTKIPLGIADYFGKGRPLIKLYNEDGRFFCYANAAGTLYYKEK